MPLRTMQSSPAHRHKGVHLQAGGGDLGEFLRPDLASFPRQKRLLEPDRSYAAALRSELLSDGKTPAKLLVGISWISKNPMAAAQKSTALADWTPILKQDSVRFVDLQYGNTADEREELKRRQGYNVTHHPQVNLTNDLDGVAALIAACDLVISVSNTTVHLAGAVGVPTWALVPPPYAQPWYWFTKGEDSPWYESVRLIRPAEKDTWSDVIKRAAADLRARLKR